MVYFLLKLICLFRLPSLPAKACPRLDGIHHLICWCSGILGTW
ncbi:rCG51129 [Rattus norvegicus]|uniref:RCG51129 n=1 Tax=Rattus norvegicus TaxID=10116 RepID=A6IZ84_RAT|nr:rCG51129 [Rattus norvegicus]